ncbi:MAG: hypothetical protein JO336_22335, partial [Acidobacteriia bacterium]|nr:hypothetical protein [Terriglobia bacterium]
MTTSTPLLENYAQAPQPARTADWHEIGERLAHSLESVPPQGSAPGAAPDRPRAFEAMIARAAVRKGAQEADAVLDNVRFLRSVERNGADFLQVARDLPAALDETGARRPRVLVLAAHYFDHIGNDFDAAAFAAFIEGFQNVTVLGIKELSEMRAALETELVDRLIDADQASWPLIVTSLQRIGNANWRDLFQAINHIDRVLAEDAAGAYQRMDFDSRERYRKVIKEVAKHSPRTEVEIARIAVRLSREGLKQSDGSRRTERRAHVGYYLADNGLALLEAEAGFQAPFLTRFRRLLLRYPAGFYLTSIELLTFLIVVGMLSGLNSLTPIFAGLILFLLPASQAAVDFINNLFVALLPTRALPKLDFSEGIPTDCVTLVAVPALLLSEEQVHDLVLDLEIRFLANRDPNLYFALLTDAPDSDQAVDQKDSLVDLAIRLVEGLNQRYSENGRSPFFLLHRLRTYNECEGRWMGWERKRGKLLDLNRALRGGLEAFPVRVGDTSVFPSVRYVLTLDADTQLPRDSARQLIGSIAHPLNQAVVDPVGKIVVEGY